MIKPTDQLKIKTVPEGVEEETQIKKRF